MKSSDSRSDDLAEKAIGIETCIANTTILLRGSFCRVVVPHKSSSSKSDDLAEKAKGIET